MVDGKLDASAGWTTKMYVDSTRNKSLVKKRYIKPVTGPVELTYLYDYTLGDYTLFSPLLGICHFDSFKPHNNDLKFWVEDNFDPFSENTTYLGEDKLPWDSTQTFWHFEHV